LLGFERRLGALQARTSSRARRMNDGDRSRLSSQGRLGGIKRSQRGSSPKLVVNKGNTRLDSCSQAAEQTIKGDEGFDRRMDEGQGIGSRIFK